MEDSDEREGSFSIPANLLSSDETNMQHSEISSLPEHSFLSPSRNTHAMGFLSLSSIPAVESSNPVHINVQMSPDGSDPFRPDILMSTIINKQTASTSDDDLSISMGPLPNFDQVLHQDDSLSYHHLRNLESSLVANVQRISEKNSRPPALGSKSIQTEESQCLKCEELHICYNQKLLDVATEFQRQYAAQFQMAEQHAKASEESQQQIKDLRDQLDGADKQLKVFSL